MERVFTIPPDTESLESLAARLEDDFYLPLEQSSKNISEALEALKANPCGELSIYLDVCSELIGRVRQFLRLRRLVLIPYILELSEKDDDGHDCRTCLGRCTIQHSEQLKRFKGSQVVTTAPLYQLQNLLIPATPGALPPAFLTLRREVMLLNSLIIRIAFLEDCFLVPKAMEAQSNIHVPG